MTTQRPMKYIVIQERQPQNGSEPNRAMVIFDAMLSPTLVCAGIVSREHELFSDGSIVEEGDWRPAPLPEDYMALQQQLGVAQARAELLSADLKSFAARAGCALTELEDYAALQEELASTREAYLNQSARLAQLKPLLDNAALQAVLAERLRQVEQLGYTAPEDDGYTEGQLAKASASYAVAAAGIGDPTASVYFWPWREAAFKPTTPYRSMVKCAALALAELERLDRIPTETPDVCTLPPEGWACRRAAGHEGPCAAYRVYDLKHLDKFGDGF